VKDLTIASTEALPCPPPEPVPLSLAARLLAVWATTPIPLAAARILPGGRLIW
jgi:hypothetical protein